MSLQSITTDAGGAHAIDEERVLAAVVDGERVETCAADDLRPEGQHKVVGSPHLLGEKNGRGAPNCRDGVECVRARGGTPCAGNKDRVRPASQRVECDLAVWSPLTLSFNASVVPFASLTVIRGGKISLPFGSRGASVSLGRQSPQRIRSTDGPDMGGEVISLPDVRNTTTRKFRCYWNMLLSPVALKRPMLAAGKRVSSVPGYSDNASTCPSQNKALARPL